MTKRVDPEMQALASVTRALDPLDTGQQKRILSYAQEKYFHQSLDLADWYKAISDAMEAITEAARQVDTAPAYLVGIILKHYQEALDEQKAQAS